MGDQELVGCAIVRAVLATEMLDPRELDASLVRGFNTHIDKCVECEQMVAEVILGFPDKRNSHLVMHVLAHGDRTDVLDPSTPLGAALMKLQATALESIWKDRIRDFHQLVLDKWGLEACSAFDMLKMLDALSDFLSLARGAGENILIFGEDGLLRCDRDDLEPCSILDNVKLISRGGDESLDCLSWLMTALRLNPGIVDSFRAVPVEGGFRMEYVGNRKEWILKKLADL